MNKVSILIITKNRPNFLLRQLIYYQSVKCLHPIYIADSSDYDLQKFLSLKLKKFSQTLTIKYFYVPKLNDRQALTLILKKSKEKYASYIGDDDFLVPNSLSKFANFLEKNDSYRNVHGRAILFSLRDKNKEKKIITNNVYSYKEKKDFEKMNNFFSEEISISEYSKPRLVEQISCKERITNFSKDYWVPFFGVQKTIHFIEDIKELNKTPHRGFGELILSFSSIARGKSKFLDCLYLARQGYEVEIKESNFLEEILDDNWRKSAYIFINALSKIITSIDKIGKKDADKLAFKVLETYYTKQILDRKTNKNKNFLRKFLFFLKRNKIIKQKTVDITKYYLSIFFAKHKPLTLYNLKKKSSPYNNDFQPIFESITTKNRTNNF